MLVLSDWAFSHGLVLLNPGRGHRIHEGMQGLARAALAGGIPCLLVPKWNIPAKESIILMMRVYAFMAMNKVGESDGILDCSEVT